MKIYLFILATFPFLLYSQDLEQYNKIYQNTYYNTATTNLPRALEIADSLYVHSSESILKLRSLMLSATLQNQAGEFKKSIDYALEARKLAKSMNNISWQARTAGFLASTYRNLDLHRISKKYAEEGMELADKIENRTAANSTKLLMYQEIAYYELEYQHFNKAIDAITKANQLLDLTPEDSRTFFTANNQQLLGVAYLGLKDYDQALRHFKEAESNLTKNETHFLATLIHTGLTKTYLGLGNTKTAKKHLDIAERMGRDTKFLQLKNELSATSKYYYSAVKDIQNTNKKLEEQQAIKDQIRTKEKEFLDDSFMESEKTTQKAESKSRLYNSLFLLAVVLLISFTVIYFWHHERQRKKLDEFRKVIQNIRQKYESQNLWIQVEIPEAKKEKIQISLKTQQKILSKLSEFEKMRMFTNKKMSLPMLATFCDTNVKHLSHIIKNHKGKSFNNYINELRVYYIIEKLETDRQLRKFKITVIADEAGFSTPNKFSTIFKQITSYTPSSFIRKLEQL